MQFFRAIRRYIAGPLAVVFFFASVATVPLNAKMVSTEEILAVEASDIKRADVTAFLNRMDVRAQLRELGVDPDEAVARVASLTDAEINRIAGQLDTLPAGQSAFGAVVVAAAALFLLLVVTDILGYTNIFPFIKAQRAPPR